MSLQGTGGLAACSCVAPLLASATAGLLVTATLLGRYALAGTVAVVQAVLLLALLPGSAVPAVRSSGMLALPIELATTGLVAVGAEKPIGSAELLPVVAAPGVALVAMAVVQLARRDGRAHLTASLTWGVTMTVLMVALVFLLAVWSDPDGVAVLLVSLAGAAIAAAFAVFPGHRLLWGAGGTVAASGVGLLVQVYAEDVSSSAVSPGPAAALAASAGLGAAGGLWSGELVAADAGGDASNAPGGAARTSPLVKATLPLTLAAPVAFGPCLGGLSLRQPPMVYCWLAWSRGTGSSGCISAPARTTRCSITAAPTPAGRLDTRRGRRPASPLPPYHG